MPMTMRSRFRVSRRFLMVLAALSVANPALAVDDGKATLDGLDTFVESTMAEWKVPGLALAIVKEGKVVRIQGYGLRDVEKKLPVTPETLFPIASISKSFTVT